MFPLVGLRAALDGAVGSKAARGKFRSPTGAIKESVKPPWSCTGAFDRAYSRPNAKIAPPDAMATCCLPSLR